MDKNNLFGILSLIFGLVSLIVLTRASDLAPNILLGIVMAVFPILALILGVFSISKKKLMVLGIIGIILGLSAYMIAFATAPSCPPQMRAEDTNFASENRPFVADREVVISNISPTATVAVSVYNAQKTNQTNMSIYIHNCSGSKGDVTANITFTKINDITVTSNSFVGLQTIIGMKKGVDGNYPFKPGDSITCKLSTANPTGALNHTTSVDINVQPE